ncbi:MAG: hypothetical protein ABI876_08940, partial [Bacteroidota bacterium]
SAPIARKLVRYYLTRQKEAMDDLPDPNHGNDQGLPSVAAPRAGDQNHRDSVPPAPAKRPQGDAIHKQAIYRHR